MKANAQVVVVASAAGFLLGFLDCVWIKYVPFVVAGLGNSVAIWAVAAFLLTYYCGWSAVRGIAGAVIMLVIAVPSYYVAAALIQNDDWSNVWSLPWTTLAVLAGVVFGLGGVLARRSARWRRPALGLPAAVLFAEMLIDLNRIGEPGYRTAELAGYAVVLTVVAVLITVAVARTRRDRTVALAYAVPLAGAGFLMLSAAALGS